MKYIYLLLAILYSASVDAQSFERLYETAHPKYSGQATASIVIGEYTIVGIEEDTFLKGNANLVKLSPNGDIVKTKSFGIGVNYSFHKFTKINDSTFFVFMSLPNATTVTVCKVDTQLNIKWIKTIQGNNQLINVKKFNENKYALIGYFDIGKKLKYLYIDSAGNTLNTFIEYKQFDPNCTAYDIVESNDTVFAIIRTPAYLNYNSLVIVSKRKNDDAVLNSLDLSLGTIIRGDHIEILNNNIIVYGQNHVSNNICKFKYTLNKQLGIVQIDSLKETDGVSDRADFFYKNGNVIFLYNSYTNKLIEIDEYFKVKRTQQILGNPGIISFNIEGDVAITTGLKYRERPFLPASYVHRFNPNVSLGLNKNIELPITLYPNPFNHQLNINFNKEQKYVNVKLYNTLGQLQYSTSFEQTQHLSLEDILLEKGMYFIEVETPEGKSGKRVIKL